MMYMARFRFNIQLSRSSVHHHYYTLYEYMQTCRLVYFVLQAASKDFLILLSTFSFSLSIEDERKLIFTLQPSTVNSWDILSACLFIRQTGCNVFASIDGCPFLVGNQAAPMLFGPFLHVIA